MKRNHIVHVPAMPETDHPPMQLWLSHLSSLVGHCDENTFFVGHSLGCQAILRYLQEQLPAVRAGGAVFVAGFETLGVINAQPDVQEGIGEWLQKEIQWEAIHGHAQNFTAIFSDNDKWVPLSNVKVFDEKLGAHTIVLHNRGHFSGSNGITELPEARDTLLEMLQ